MVMFIKLLWSCETCYAHNVLCLWLASTLFTRTKSISLDKGRMHNITWYLLPLADFMFTQSNKLCRKQNIWWRIGMRMIRFVAMFYAINMSLRYKTVNGISVMLIYRHAFYGIFSGLILDLSPANERQCNFVATSHTGRWKPRISPAYCCKWHSPYDCGIHI